MNYIFFHGYEWIYAIFNMTVSYNSWNFDWLKFTFYALIHFRL